MPPDIREPLEQLEDTFRRKETNGNIHIDRTTTYIVLNKYTVICPLYDPLKVPWVIGKPTHVR